MTPLAPAAQRRARAYLILGVDPNSVASSPRITPFIRKMPGGWPKALEYLRASDLPEARHFVSKYDNLLLPASVRRDLPIEAFAVAAGLSPTRLWGVIVECGRTFEAQRGSLVAASRHVEVVEASVNAALTPDGVTDRTHQLKHAGFLPLPKGSQISVQVNATATSSSRAAALAATEAPAPEDTIRRIIERRQQGQLSTPAVAALPPATAADSIPPAFAPMRSRDAVTIDARESDDATDVADDSGDEDDD